MDATSQQGTPTPPLREETRAKEAQRSRLLNRTHMQLRHQEQRERIQLIRDDDTGKYLKYRQLIRNPKHNIVWNRSSANKFGQLAQGLPDGRVIGTNTIFFIHRNLVSKDRLKDVTYYVT